MSVGEGGRRGKGRDKYGVGISFRSGPFSLPKL